MSYEDGNARWTSRTHKVNIGKSYLPDYSTTNLNLWLKQSVITYLDKSKLWGTRAKSLTNPFLRNSLIMLFIPLCCVLAAAVL